MDRVSDLLTGFLDFAVPLEMQRMRALDNETLRRIAAAQSEQVGNHGDVILYGGKGCATATAALIRALAAAALVAEGGITFAGRHWCRDHNSCRAMAS